MHVQNFVHQKKCYFTVLDEDCMHLNRMMHFLVSFKALVISLQLAVRQLTARVPRPANFGGGEEIACCHIRKVIGLDMILDMAELDIVPSRIEAAGLRHVAATEIPVAEDIFYKH